MSKTITVPDIGSYPIRMRINQTDYTLTPGATATVPDEVAVLLAGIVAARPAPDPDGGDARPATIADVREIVTAAITAAFSAYTPPTELPDYADAEDGSVLTVDDGELAWIVPEPTTVDNAEGGET